MCFVLFFLPCCKSMQPTFSVGKDRGKVYSTRLAFGKLGSILAPARKNCLAQRVKKKFLPQLCQTVCLKRALAIAIILTYLLDNYYWGQGFHVVTPMCSVHLFLWHFSWACHLLSLFISLLCWLACSYSTYSLYGVFLLFKKGVRHWIGISSILFRQERCICQF